jgi:hypothetical protein
MPHRGCAVAGFEIVAARDIAPRAVVLGCFRRACGFSRHPNQSSRRSRASHARPQQRSPRPRHNWSPPASLEKRFGRCGIQEKSCYFRILELSLGVVDMTEAGLVADVEKEAQIGQAMAPIDTPFRSGIG